MTGICKRCGDKDKLYERSDGNYCYDCKRVTPIPKVVSKRSKGRKIKI